MMGGEMATFHGLAIAGYALIGMFLGLLYYASPRARQEPLVHLLTALVIVLAVAIVGFAASLELRTLEPLHLGIPLLFFGAASLLYVPVIIFLVLHYWETLVEKLTSPGSTSEPPREPRGAHEQWRAVEAHLKLLSANPGDAATHERLGDLYARLSHWDAAIYEYKKAADWRDHGYAQGHVLSKEARLLIEKKEDIPGATILLRRIVRLYPKSWFASYARRILSHWEARQEQEGPKRPGPASQA